MNAESSALLVLRFWGTVCPCLENEEDGPARRAAWALSGSGVPVRWHRRVRSSPPSDSGGSKAVSAARSVFSGIFGGCADGVGCEASNETAHEAVENSALSVVDTKSGPALQIAPPSSSTGVVPSKTIPLRRMKMVQAYSDGILSSLGAGLRSGVILHDRFGKELLRFDVLRFVPGMVADSTDLNEDGGSEETVDADEEARDDAVDRLQILAEWERRRRAALNAPDDDETTNDEEEKFDDEAGGNRGLAGKKTGKGGGGVLAEKARKIQHFAQREIEMQKTKRERENRKSKYMQDSGGLKYTAIAMANRASSK